MTKNTAVDVTHSINFTTQRARIVYVALASFSNKSNTCFPSVSTIAERCGLSERSVQRAIADLIAMELVNKAMRHREDNGCTSNIYTLIEPQMEDVNCQLSIEMTPAPRQADGGEGDSLTPAIEYDNSFNQSNLTSSLQTDAREDKNEKENENADITLDEVLENCEFNYIRINYGEDFANVLRNTVLRLYYSERLRVGNAMLPRSVILQSLRYLNYHALQIAIDKLKFNPKREVRSSSAYLTVLLYNTITEMDIDWYCGKR